MLSKMLSREDIQRYEADGFLVIEPGFLNHAFLEGLSERSDAIFPSWSEKDVLSRTENAEFLERTPRFRLGDIVIEGCALTRRSYMRNVGPKLPSDLPNWLHGRKAVLETPFWDGVVAAMAQDDNLLAYAKQLLGSDDLSLLSGTIEKTYPGYTGHDRRFHITFAKFTKDILKADQSGHAILSIAIVVNDITDQEPLFRIIPQSHLRYREIDSCVRASWGKNYVCDCIQKGVYEEILPASLKRPVKIGGKSGTIIMFNGLSLYSDLGNTIKDRPRTIVYLHLCGGRYKQFSIDYSTAPLECRRFAAHFSDITLVKEIFIDVSQDWMRFAVQRIKSLINRIGQRAILFRRFSPSRLIKYVNKRSVVPAIRFFKPKPFGVNVGAGSGWRHPTFFSLDLDHRADLVHDLASGRNFPVKSASLYAVYSSHCIEHLTDEDARRFFRESRDSLKKDGILRVTCPDMDIYFDAYDRRDLSLFVPYLERETNRYDSWLRYIVRSFAEPVVDRYSDDEIYELYRTMDRKEFLMYFSSLVAEIDSSATPHMHKSWWTIGRLKEALEKSGFSDVYESRPYCSRVPAMRNRHYFDTNNPDVSLWVEACK